MGPIIAAVGTMAGVLLAAALGADPYAISAGVTVGSVVGYAAGRLTNLRGK